MTTTTHTDALAELGTARRIKGLEPGSDAWRTTITASKIASILGVDKFGGTRYQTWLTMAGEWCDDFTGNSSTDRGSFLEDGIARWWAKDHDRTVEWAGTWQNIDMPWAVATPDYITADADGLALLEVKTDAHMDGWGEPGTGAIPEHYWCQVIWQAIVTGVRRVYVTVLGSFLERQDYVVEVDEFTASMLLDEVRAFRDTLPGQPGELRPLSENPDLDWRAILAVTEVVRDEATADAAVLDEYRAAKIAEAEAKARAESAKHAMVAAAADAGAIMDGKKTVASRNKSGTFTFRPVKK